MNYYNTGKSGKLINLLFPMATYCICCGNFIDESRAYCICDHCIRHMTWGNINVDLKEQDRKTGRKSHLSSVRACLKYGLYERRLIFDLKYNGHTYVARVIAQIMYDRIENDAEAAELKNIDIIVPVPVHKDRENKRGFNQAEKVAKHLGHLTKMECRSDILIRNRSTEAQRSVAGSERYENLEGAFKAAAGEKTHIAGKQILLIDDVYTTGATANRCAEVLLRAGASSVHLFVLATGNDFAHGFFT